MFFYQQLLLLLLLLLLLPPSLLLLSPQSLLLPTAALGHVSVGKYPVHDLSFWRTEEKAVRSSPQLLLHV